jgi:large subunit ribosomal protein L31
MKEDIHPTYYKNAKAICSCGNTFTIGSTKKEIKVELCNKCHPFFTGEQRVVDTAGRVERFRRRYSRQS